MGRKKSNRGGFSLFLVNFCWLTFCPPGTALWRLGWAEDGQADIQPVQPPVIFQHRGRGREGGGGRGQSRDTLPSSAPPDPFREQAGSRTPYTQGPEMDPVREPNPSGRGHYLLFLHASRAELPVVVELLLRLLPELLLFLLFRPHGSCYGASPGPAGPLPGRPKGPLPVPFEATTLGRTTSPDMPRDRRLSGERFHMSIEIEI